MDSKLEHPEALTSPGDEIQDQQAALLRFLANLQREVGAGNTQILLVTEEHEGRQGEESNLQRGVGFDNTQILVVKEEHEGRQGGESHEPPHGPGLHITPG